MKSFSQCVAVPLVLLMAIMVGQRLASAALPEYQVKAAFLLNFAKFVEWPATAFADERAPFVLGILGTDPFGNVLDALNGQVVKSRTVHVQRLSSLESIRQCHILYLSSSEEGRIRDIVKTLGDAPVLTVSDGLVQFAQYGVSINLLLVDNKVRFEISVAVARKVGLTVGTQLLQVGKVVETGQ